MSSNNWLLSLKIVLISTGVVSMAVALKLSVPVAADIVASQLPSLWSSLLSWLRPPYLYILINCIIISIVASSKLHSAPKPEDHHDSEIIIPPPPEMAVVPPVKISAAEARPDYAAYNGVALSDYGYDSHVLPKDSDSYGGAVAAETVEVLEPENEMIKVLAEVNGGDNAVTAASRPARSGLQRKDSMEFWLNENQKPPVSSRFAHRKSIRASPEGGKSLGVSRPKRHDTLESTWKTITDGRSVPLTRHLKKSDTWERRMDQNTPPPPMADKMMHKSETFHERSSTTATGSPVSGQSAGRLRKEPSLSQDELNRRVEAFINKFNEEMRLQRQESLNQYQEMVGRGAQAAPLAH
ncbi:PREDICTED: uncharacterized protein LOC101300989 [Fragaria vesca subsp. vesca]|uniref:uncharacterized protein LOC101300989 n=1 Tax=Fragaria vesca subsp. vesca TaxID=101020 RepID=UPI0002C35D2B|nr:PREDICTED: uncharacterized protein LOC101300989 [Fragaria vesca subsp. vesca]